MSLGPIELLVVKFPGNKFRGEIAPALAELVNNGTIQIVDFVFIVKDEDGNVEAVQLTDLEDEYNDLLGYGTEEVSGLLSDDDVIDLARLLEPNSSAALMLFENVWATRFRDAVLRADGQLILNERLPHAIVEEVLALSEY
jgi:uncharacterized membrane protein